MVEKQTKLYSYVGSKEIKNSVVNYPIGIRIRSKKDIEHWIDNSDQEFDNSGFIICTFVIDSEGYLRIADRHSEHVACSDGKPVQSAGEIFIIMNKNECEIVEISNQSTGFCPEPESWFSVNHALNKIGIDHPGEFTVNFIFRRCGKCNLLNVVKDNLFICADCNEKLPQNWNCNII